jgi:hypothetical protein
LIERSGLFDDVQGFRTSGGGQCGFFVELQVKIIIAINIRALDGETSPRRETHRQQISTRAKVYPVLYIVYRVEKSESIQSGHRVQVKDCPAVAIEEAFLGRVMTIAKTRESQHMIEVPHRGCFQIAVLVRYRCEQRRSRVRLTPK